MKNDEWAMKDDEKAMKSEEKAMKFRSKDHSPSNRRGARRAG